MIEYVVDRKLQLSNKNLNPFLLTETQQINDREDQGECVTGQMV